MVPAFGSILKEWGTHNHTTWLSHYICLSLLALCLNGSCAAPDSHSETARPVVLSWRFVAGTGGWGLVGDNAVKGPSVCHKSLCAEDFGPATWNFFAPPEQLGNVSTAAGGLLVVHRGFFELNRGRGWSSLMRGNGLFDVSLESHWHGMRIGVTDLVEDGSFSMKQEVHLGASGGWMHVDGSMASDEDIRKVLGSLSNLFIRGGHYEGSEHVFVSEVTVLGALPKTDTGRNGSSVPAGQPGPAVGQREKGEGSLQRALREREASAASSVVVIMPQKQQHSQQQLQQQQLQQHIQTQHHHEQEDDESLLCVDDGTGLPVARLMETARLSKSALHVCLSSRDGAFSLSTDTIFYLAAGPEATIQTAKLTLVEGVSVDNQGRVVIVGKGNNVLIQGCYMTSFEMDQVAEFFEACAQRTANVSSQR